MLKKEKEKFYAITIAVMLIGLVLVWQGIFSSRMAIGNKILEILDKKAFIGAYSQREEALPVVLNNYSSAKEKIDEVNERFVSGADSADVDKFFNELEGIADETSIQLEKVFIENPEIIKKTAKKPPTSTESEPQTEDDKFLRLTIKGKYENLLAFIYKLEAMPYYIDIKSVSIDTNVDSQRDLSGGKSNPGSELQGMVIIRVFKKQDINEKK